MGTHKTEKLLHSSGNNRSSKEETFRVGIIFLGYASSRILISRTYKDLKKQSQEKKIVQLKGALWIKTEFSNEEIKLPEKYPKNCHQS